MNRGDGHAETLSADGVDVSKSSATEGEANNQDLLKHTKAALASDAPDVGPREGVDDDGYIAPRPYFMWGSLCASIAGCCFAGPSEYDAHGSVHRDRLFSYSPSSSGQPRPAGPSEADGKPAAIAVLPPQRPGDVGRKTLVLDLDETLVHSSFTFVPDADHQLTVEVEGTMTNIYVKERPGLHEFLRDVGELYEVGVFTASVVKYADPLLDIIDRSHVVRWRLFRESCCMHEGAFVKDLACLGRDLKDTIIIDNSPGSYLFHPENAIPIKSFIDDDKDTHLTELLPLLKSVVSARDVREQLAELISPEMRRRSQDFIPGHLAHI